MRIFLQALILVLVMEGICFALFPGKMRQALLELASSGEETLRALGIGALIAALIFFFLLSVLA